MVKKEVSRSVDYISSDDPWGFEPGEFRGPARPIPHVADDGGGSWGRAGGGGRRCGQSTCAGQDRVKTKAKAGCAPDTQPRGQDRGAAS